jgi:hypothetical protein
MRPVLKGIILAFGSLLLLVVACLAADRISYARARPPKQVTDFRSCMAWLKPPIGAYKLSDRNTIYYQVTGPPGRSLPTGPAAYTFDRSGKLIGWTPDVGDKDTPGLKLSAAAKRERVSFEELWLVLASTTSHQTARSF